MAFELWNVASPNWDVLASINKIQTTFLRLQYEDKSIKYPINSFYIDYMLKWVYFGNNGLNKRLLKSLKREIVQRSTSGQNGDCAGKNMSKSPFSFLSNKTYPFKYLLFLPIFQCLTYNPAIINPHIINNHVLFGRGILGSKSLKEKNYLTTKRALKRK